MAYSTVTRVRQEAGFANNSNILDARITPHLAAATAIVNSYISPIYARSALSGALFTGSDAENFLKKCEELLGAGFLMIDEFGIQEDEASDSKNGQHKVDLAISWLTQIQKGEMKLLDINGDELASAGINSRLAPASGVDSYQTNNSAGQSMDRSFHSSMEF
jgi:hypothetical protein